MREAIPLLRQYAFMAWCLVKAQRQFYLIFYLHLDQVSVPEHHGHVDNGSALS